MNNEKISSEDRVEFTLEMKRDYTILVPDMLPNHIELFANVLREYGYHIEMLRKFGQSVVDEGLMYVHNDMC